MDGHVSRRQRISQAGNVSRPQLIYGDGEMVQLPQFSQVMGVGRLHKEVEVAHHFDA